MVKVTINDVVYTVPELNFNAVCTLAEAGVDIMNTKAMRKNVVNSARGIVAWIMDVEPEEAGNEIEQHVINGGTIDTIFEAFGKAVDESGFFSAMRESKKVVPQDHKRKAAKSANAD